MAESHDKTFVPTAILSDIAAQLPGEFQLLEYVGEGGHGIVFKAFYKPLQQVVALKIIKSDTSDDMRKRIERMQNEAKILSRVNHPNIVTLHRMGTCKDGTPFLVCEFLEGITLRRYLEQNRQIKPKPLFDIFTQILEALKYSHQQGLIHRDIKPGNIMLVNDAESQTFQVKLLDFGIARDFEFVQPEKMGLTRTIQISGSAPYMSPEQCRGEKIDLRSDIYSLACVLYESLAGHPPFRGETPLHTRYLQIHKEAELPEGDRIERTSSRIQLYALALAGLSKDRNKRPQSAEEFDRILRKACEKSSKSQNWSNRNRFRSLAFMSTLLITLAAAATAIGYLLAQHNQATPQVPIRKAVHDKVLPRSIVLQLHNIYEEHYKVLAREEAGNEKAIIDRLNLFIRLSTLIDSIDKSDQAMLYSAWALKSEMQWKMKLVQQLEETIKKTLTYCQTKDGQYTIEAADELLLLAKAINMRDPGSKEAERLAFEALALRQKFESAPDTVPIIPLNTLIDYRTGGGAEEPYMVLASIYAGRKDYTGELKYYQLAKLRLTSHFGITSARVATFEMARLLHDLNRQNEAYNLVDHYETELAAQPREYRDSFAMMNCFNNTAGWAIDNKRYALARRAIEHGLRFISMMPYPQSAYSMAVMQKNKSELLQLKAKLDRLENKN